MPVRAWALSSGKEDTPRDGNRLKEANNREKKLSTPTSKAKVSMPFRDGTDDKLAPRKTEFSFCMAIPTNYL